MLFSLSLSLSFSFLLTAQADHSKSLPSTYDHGLNYPVFLLCLCKFILISDDPFGSNNLQGFSWCWLMQGNLKPAWLEALYAQKFFVGCSYHENAKKNEKNICCLDCCTSICPHCLPSHRFHRLLQVRRYVYHDVVRLEDLQKLIDCSNVQVYLHG